MNKELTELRELITEREKVEVDFQAGVAKLDGRIAALLTKIQGKATPPKPVEVEGYTRDKPRKTRSDKGKARKDTPAPTEPPAASGDEPEGQDPDTPIGQVVGQVTP